MNNNITFTGFIKLGRMTTTIFGYNYNVRTNGMHFDVLVICPYILCQDQYWGHPKNTGQDPIVGKPTFLAFARGAW